MYSVYRLLTNGACLMPSDIFTGTTASPQELMLCMKAGWTHTHANHSSGRAVGRRRLTCQPQLQQRGLQCARPAASRAAAVPAEPIPSSNYSSPQRCGCG